MCGIVGFVANTSKYASGWKAQRDGLGAFAKESLYANAVRGMDATGIMSVHKNAIKSPASHFKRALDAADFLRMPRAQKLLESLDDVRMWVGHNRYSTVDRTTVADRNAHPFQVDHITLVHNGTLQNYFDFKQHPEGVSVDSARAATEIAAMGAEAALPKMKGAYVLVWHNALKGTFNVFRNDKKPLQWCRLKDETTDWGGFVFGSEPDMLHWIILRNGLPYHNEWRDFQDSYWYEFDLEDPEKFTKTKIVPAPEVPGRGPFGETKEMGIRGGRLIGLPNDSGQGMTSKEKKLHIKLKNFGFSYRQVIKAKKSGFVPYRNQRDRGEASFSCSSRGVIIHSVSKGAYDALPEFAELVVVGIKGGILVAEIPPKEVPKRTSSDFSCDHCGGFLNPSHIGTIISNHSMICHICAEDDDLLKSLGVRAS